MPNLLAIVGPTAVGKTALSIALAKKLNGEIISCDSMQIYRKMDIGTAKPTLAERDGVPHHLFDIVDAAEPFSCADYQEKANAAVQDILSRGKLPIFCGGTGLYLDSVLYDRPFAEIPCDMALRARLNARENKDLYAELCKVDPNSAAATHQNNKKRVVRALEVYYLTGKPKSVWDAESHNVTPRYDAVVIGLDESDRARLYARIDARVDEMVAQGLEQEVKDLALDRQSTAAQAIGYHEFLDYFDRLCDRETAISQIKQHSRNYAKRQLTWFRAKPYLHWIVRQEHTTKEDVLAQALAIWQNASKEGI